LGCLLIFNILASYVTQESCINVVEQVPVAGIVAESDMEGKVIPVKVAVRSRPMVDKEVNEGCQCNIMFVPNEPQLVIGKDKAFTFDFVYSEDSSQDQVYRESVKPLVNGLFRGLSSTCVLY